MAITSLYSNSKDITDRTLAAQRAVDEVERWNRDFADGKRRFWAGDSLMYCANNVERAGYWAAADEAHEEVQREREHADFVRSLGH